jgi:hypothetical protein
VKSPGSETKRSSAKSKNNVRRETTKKSDSEADGTDSDVSNAHLLPQKTKVHHADSIESPARTWFELLISTRGEYIAIRMSLLLSLFLKWTVSLNGYSGIKSF